MRFGLEYHQTHDETGAAAPALFDHVLPERTLRESALEDIYRAIRDLTPARTENRGVVAYESPDGSRGFLVVHGLDTEDLERFEERVQIHELERAIGMRDPYLWDRRSAGGRRTFRNPWMTVVLGSLVAVGGAVMVASGFALHETPGRDPAVTWVSAVGGILLAGLGAFLTIFNVRRIPWWTRARAAVRAAGLPMPSDLRADH